MYTHICLFLQKKCQKNNPQAYENEYLQRMEGDDAERTELAFQVSPLYMVPSLNKANVLHIYQTILNRENYNCTKQKQLNVTAFQINSITIQTK